MTAAEHALHKHEIGITPTGSMTQSIWLAAMHTMSHASWNTCCQGENCHMTSIRSDDLHTKAIDHRDHDSGRKLLPVP